MALGLLISKGVETIAGGMGIFSLKAFVSAQLIIGALSFSFIVGVISGLLPAREASRMQPVDAMRR